jgi:hypothetical protein
MRRLLVWAGAALLLVASPAAAQMDLSGEWVAHTDEDQPHRVPGAELGDYTGLPINEAARQKADSWDASILSQPEQQAKPHPAQVLHARATPGCALDQDRRSGQRSSDCLHDGRHVRSRRSHGLDGWPSRIHPSSPSTPTQASPQGEWVDNGLKVTTTHMKTAFIQRNGVPSSYRAVMTEFFVRHGNNLLMLSIVDDPVYLDEPLVRTQNWVLAGGPARRSPRSRSRSSTSSRIGHVAGCRIGLWEPTHTEFADRFGLPFEATRGGKASVYPEYVKTIERLEREQPPRPRKETAR